METSDVFLDRLSKVIQAAVRFADWNLPADWTKWALEFICGKPANILVPPQSEPPHKIFSDILFTLGDFEHAWAVFNDIYTADSDEAERLMDNAVANSLIVEGQVKSLLEARGLEFEIDRSLS
ncbi:MAG: hypothetical protein UX06_C0043G0004 [Candidatus Giovannonibacteria bacterium GW2011_GWA2_45_21]|nr:MAG: hypothetical protein UX06_C0043G0004 [Candidatus Giovannonibacteria bacterium GW2011_GWA2_45_21]